MASDTAYLSSPIWGPSGVCQAHRGILWICVHLLSARDCVFPTFTPHCHAPALCGSGDDNVQRFTETYQIVSGGFIKTPNCPTRTQPEPHLQSTGFPQPGWKEVQSTQLTTRWQCFPASGPAEAGIPASCVLNPASVPPEAISGKRSFTKETFTKDENSRIKYSETEELEDVKTISQYHVLTQPALHYNISTVLCPFAVWSRIRIAKHPSEL